MKHVDTAQDLAFPGIAGHRAEKTYVSSHLAVCHPMYVSLLSSFDTDMATDTTLEVTPEFRKSNSIFEASTIYFIRDHLGQNITVAGFSFRLLAYGGGCQTRP